MGLSMGVMIAGYDKRGPGLYYVDRLDSFLPFVHAHPSTFRLLSSLYCALPFISVVIVDLEA